MFWELVWQLVRIALKVEIRAQLADKHSWWPRDRRSLHLSAEGQGVVLPPLSSPITLQANGGSLWALISGTARRDQSLSRQYPTGSKDSLLICRDVLQSVFLRYWGLARTSQLTHFFVTFKLFQVILDPWLIETYGGGPWKHSVIISCYLLNFL